MSPSYSQVERLGRLTTVLGDDVLVLLRFDGSDHMNELFEYRVEALAERGDIDFNALMGTHASVTVEGVVGPRHFDGIVTQVRWAGAGENGHRYDLVLRPWCWLASRRRNQRIFHNQSVVEILRTLFAEYAPLGDPALELKLSEDYAPLEYTVQYRESDLDFARRQMERAGISFHFRHAPGSHTMVLTDDVLAHASAKLQRKRADWIVANDVSPATGIMGGTENAVTLITADGAEAWPRMPKDEVARKLAARIAEALGQPPQEPQP
jgi:type VI secretion system secreted protein VgrG